MESTVEEEKDDMAEAYPVVCAAHGCKGRSVTPPKDLDFVQAPLCIDHLIYLATTLERTIGSPDGYGKHEVIQEVRSLIYPSAHSAPRFLLLVGGRP